MNSIKINKPWAAATTLPLIIVLFALLLTWSTGNGTETNSASRAIPRMIDLGRNQCLPCKMMAPVLADLKREFAGVIDIEYVNIAENPDAMTKLGLPVRAVPFQVFYDGSGRIVKRHYGYMSKDEILDAFKTLGFGHKKQGGTAR